MIGCSLIFLIIFGQPDGWLRVSLSADLPKNAKKFSNMHLLWAPRLYLHASSSMGCEVHQFFWLCKCWDAWKPYALLSRHSDCLCAVGLDRQCFSSISKYAKNSPFWSFLWSSGAYFTVRRESPVFSWSTIVSPFFSVTKVNISLFDMFSRKIYTIELKLIFGWTASRIKILLW